MSDGGSSIYVPSHATQESQQQLSDSASDSSKNSSTTSPTPSRSRGRPRKRTTTALSPSSQSRSKRLLPLYNDKYRDLFNSTVNEIASGKSSKLDTSFQDSQNGVTVWSSEEKKIFFHSLSRRGRHDIRGIASDVGTKSESEVYVYSDTLYKAALNQQIYQSRKKSLQISDLEAAFEVQEDCCMALGLAAEALSELQRNEEERAEKKKHNGFSLLTPTIARRIERCMVGSDGGTEDVIHRVPAARDLNLLNFLALSKRLFMNSVIAEDNWRSYIGRGNRSPSIMHTAFTDLHALLLSITRRLVQSTLFFAMSRLRAMSSSGNYTPGLYARRRDVKAAIDVLGMEHDAKAIWAKVARKCRLRVFDKVRHRQVLGKRYSYTELESILSTSRVSNVCNPGSPDTEARDANIPSSRRGRKPRDPSASAPDDPALTDSMSVDGGRSSDEELSASSSQSTNSQDHKQEIRDGFQDARAEALDQQASRDEQRRLWEMLGEDPTENMEPVNVKPPERPFSSQKPPFHQPLSWRDSIDYAGEWETHESPVFGGSYANQPGCGKDVDPAAGLTSSGSSSGSLRNDVSEAEHESDSDGNADGDGASSDNSAHTRMKTSEGKKRR